MGNENDIFDSFFGNEPETKPVEEEVEEKTLQPNYNYLKSESVSYFIRNNCPILALMLDGTNQRAHRSYDLCAFLLTGQVNPTVYELVEDM